MHKKNFFPFFDFEEDWPNLIKMIATILYAHIFLQYKTRVLLSFIQLELQKIKYIYKIKFNYIRDIATFYDNLLKEKQFILKFEFDPKIHNSLDPIKGSFGDDADN